MPTCRRCCSLWFPAWFWAGLLFSCGPKADGEPPVARSAHYSLYFSGSLAGGGWSRSDHYEAFVGVGAPASWSTSATVPYRLAAGFVPALNDPPAALPDTIGRARGQTTKVIALRLLSNDTDPEGDPLEFVSHAVRSASGGRLTFDNGWILYEPPVGQPMFDTFTYALQDTAGHQSTQTVFVVVSEPDPGPSLNLVRITVLPTGHRQLVFAGVPGRSYTLEWSDILPATRWQPLAEVEADARGLIQWVDATEPPPPTRFYRTVAR